MILIVISAILMKMLMFWFVASSLLLTMFLVRFVLKDSCMNISMIAYMSSGS